MLALDLLAERRLQEAVNAGELDNLPGRGKPLRLTDDSLVPESLRAAYRVLSNAGLAPRTVQLRSEMAALERQLASLGEGAERARARRRLALLHFALEAQPHAGARAAGTRAS